MTLHYQPREGKGKQRAKAIRQQYTQCASCDSWTHCTQRKKAWLCLTCRTAADKEEAEA